VHKRSDFGHGCGEAHDAALCPLRNRGPKIFVQGETHAYRASATGYDFAQLFL
jgi:hypothetical protein